MLCKEGVKFNVNETINTGLSENRKRKRAEEAVSATDTKVYKVDAECMFSFP